MKISVLLLALVSFTMCHGMSKDEIEDFSNYLKRTAVLDQNLKDGSESDDGSAHDEAISDHAWEESGKFEGDLILNERQRRLIVEDVAEGLSRNGLKDSTKRWPDNEVIYYIQREHFTSDQMQAIKDGIDDLAMASCIKFRPYRKGDRDAVVIQGSRRGCFSQVGYQGGFQVLNLSGRHPVGRGCFRHGTVVHELLHTLGFYHMQSSPDRDEYIHVAWENIIQPARHNFRKYNSFAVSDFGVGYDYDSVLHYSRRAFSSNGRDTLIPKQGGAQIGQRVGLSEKDTQKLNKMYCDADSDSFDEVTHTSKPSKKKKTRNQPFQGHGIGYHQGKTVVIKVPVAETYKLSEYPTYHEFDYFSKAPEAVLPKLTEGFRTGKEISYVSLASSDNTYPDNEHIPANEDVQGTNSKIPQTVENSEVTNDNKPGSQTEVKPLDPKVKKDLLEAFEKLGNVIKMHVHPSEMPAQDLKNVKTDISKSHKYKSQEKNEPDVKKIDDLLTKDFTSINNYSNDEKPSIELEEHISKGNNIDPAIFYRDKSNHDALDSSYRTSLPFKNSFGKSIKTLHLIPEYDSDSDKHILDIIRNNNKYSNLQRSPISDGWYKNVDGKNHVRIEDGIKSKDFDAEIAHNNDPSDIHHSHEELTNIAIEKDKHNETKKSDTEALSYPSKSYDYSTSYKSHEEVTYSPYLGNIESIGDPKPVKTNERYKDITMSSIIRDKKDNVTAALTELRNYFGENNSTGKNDKESLHNLSERKLSTLFNKNHDFASGSIDSSKPTDFTKLLVKYTTDKSISGTTDFAVTYTGTEKYEEKKHDNKSHSDTKHVTDTSDVYTNFEDTMNDRLEGILKNYENFENFDIASPPSNINSYESEEYNDSNESKTDNKYRIPLDYNSFNSS